MTARGSSTISFSVKDTGAALGNANVEVQVFNSSGTAVGTGVFSGQNFTVNGTLPFRYIWTPSAQNPAVTATGNYTVEIGVFNSAWSADYYWNSNAATITLTAPATATPTFSPAAGTYTSAQSLTISDTTSGATVYYTTNSMTPTTSSTKYTGAVVVNSTETIKAIAVASGYSQSAVASGLYTINAGTPSFTATATASPTSIALSGSSTVAVSVKDTGAALSNANVEVQVFNASGTAVGTGIFSGQNFIANGTLPFTYVWTPSVQSPAVTAAGNYTVIIGVFSSAWSTDYYWNSHAASITLTVANSSAAAGTIPSGFPSRFTVGLYEENGGTWMRNSGVRWDARYRYFTQGWVNNWGYSARDGSWGLGYLKECDSQGFTPVVQYYLMNGVSGYNESAFLATAQDSAKMADYFGQWKILMERVRDFGKPAVILVEGDGFGFLEGQSGDNPNAYAAVAATGMPELAGLPNTVAGWGLAFLQLRASVGAGNAILAMDISGWGTGKDLLYFNVTDPLGPEVDKAYAFLAPLGLSANRTGQTWDLLTNNPLDRDSDYYMTLGQNRWWDASDSATISSESFTRYAEWLRLWNVKAGKRWVLWQIPLGNSNHLNVYNNGNPREGYKDNRPEYFFAESGDAHKLLFAGVGVIGLFFGPGAGGMSFYTNDVNTDGQLFMKGHAGVFLNSGGLPIQ